MTLTMPRMPDNSIAYAIGDIHGCSGLLDAVLNWITTHAASHREMQKTVVVLGDIVDRGPDIKGTLERLVKSPPDGFDFKCLRGNHEDMMLEVMAQGTGLSRWIANGGDKTLESYGVDFRELLSLDSPGMTIDILEAAVPDDHRRFLRDLLHYHQAGDYLFVHAGVRPGIAMEKQTPEDMMWIRREFTEYPLALDYHVVHGHTVTPVVDFRGSATGLDTGAVTTGRLSCLAVWEDKMDVYTTTGPER